MSILLYKQLFFTIINIFYIECYYDYHYYNSYDPYRYQSNDYNQPLRDRFDDYYEYESQQRYGLHYRENYAEDGEEVEKKEKYGGIRSYSSYSDDIDKMFGDDSSQSQHKDEEKVEKTEKEKKVEKLENTETEDNRRSLQQSNKDSLELTKDIKKVVVKSLPFGQRIGHYIDSIDVVYKKATKFPKEFAQDFSKLFD
ncbi:uncharacterized protein LOC128957974 [Oppia nitens]|uniref:uncharacterized protein LOC128957974 n=1 Tax=Oppia nitens TaxID=1686743 RepID=UPI0023DC39CF|nr:uncharacterized protein LOC128957974 [Oppia nitens]